MVSSWSPSSDSIALFANADLPDTPRIRHLLSKCPCILAVDGGLRHCNTFKRLPELLIGDFDSYLPHFSSTYQNIPQIHTPDQNYTDLEKALRFLLPFHPSKITVFGAIGGRLDHTLKNLSLLTHYPGQLFFETPTEQIHCLQKKSLITCTQGQTLSLVPYGTATKVTTSGLQWNLQRATLDKNFVSISNRSLTEQISIDYETGDLLLCLNFLEQ